MSSAPRRTAGGGWETWVAATVDGRRRRKHIRGRTKKEVIAEAECVRSLWLSGQFPEGGEVSLGAWLTTWMAERKVAGARPSTLSGYRTDLKHLDTLSDVRLDKLTPERIGRLWGDLLVSGLSGGSVRHVRRTLSAALTVAVDRGRLNRNPARLAPCPPDTTPDVQPLTHEEAQQLLNAAAEVRGGVRWAIALALGLRQGEVLALQWDDLDLDTATLRIRRSLDRVRNSHGCSAPKQCGRAARCPRRISTGGAAPLKTRGSARTLALPEVLVAMLRSHRASQNRDRLLASDLWQDDEWVFANNVGRVRTFRADWDQWRSLLASAGITRRVRIHDLRHSAATFSLVAGTDSLVVQALFGWTSPTLVARYTHVVDDTRRQAADRIGAMLWPDADRGTG